MNPKQPPRYQAYMLRMWEERPGDQGEGQGQGAVWRFQVEEPHTGRRRGFNGLPALFAYLQWVVDRDEDAGSGSAPADR
ncbi:MAG: hypothetical protein ACJ78Q_01845 [Chloroflexia bacterium]